MTRFLQSSMQAAANSSHIAYRTLVDLGVTSSTLRVCNGYQFIYTNGNTYSPIGNLGGIEAIQEEADLFPRNVTLYMSAVGSANLYEPLREDMFNRPIRVYRNFLDQGTSLPVASAELMWKGFVDAVEIHMGDAERGDYYEVRGETILRRTAKSQYFNRETFRLIDSSDTFGDHAPNIPGYIANWGQENVSAASPTPPPGAHPAWTPAWRTPYKP